MSTAARSPSFVEPTSVTKKRALSREVSTLITMSPRCACSANLRRRRAFATWTMGMSISRDGSSVAGGGAEARGATAGGGSVRTTSRAGTIGGRAFAAKTA